MNNELKGVIVPLITPLDIEGHVDENDLRGLVSHCINKGINAIFINGSGGESTNLLPHDRIRTLNIANDEIGGRIPLLCGVLESSTAKVIEGVKTAQDSGAEYIVVTVPYYYGRLTDDEMYRHFYLIASNSTAKILLYDIPKYTNSTISVNLVEKLSAIPNIIGIKISNMDFSVIQNLLNIFDGSNFRIFQGITAYAGISMLIGAHGYIPVMAPLMPELFCALSDAAQSGHIKKTVRLQHLTNSLGKLQSVTNNQYACAKYAISLLNLTKEYITLPGNLLTEEQKSQVRQIYDKVLRDWDEYIGK